MPASTINSHHPPPQINIKPISQPMSSNLPSANHLPTHPIQFSISKPTLPNHHHAIPSPSKAPPIQLDQLSQIDKTELARQWGPHLIPLQFVIQRTIAQVFGELQLLAQASPALDDFERKKRVIDYVIHSRRQIIKLLVLVKWSSNSASVHKIMSIVGFLQRQNQQFDRTVDILRSSKENLYSARMRNYDLSTALQVLTQGYPTLPGRLLEQVDSKPPLTDTEVIKLMETVNELIRFRLGSSEVLPAQFRPYRIHDGRVTFTIPEMFACSLTVGGGEPNAQWYLLQVEFLFKVTGPRGKDFSSIPQGPVRNQIIELGNRVMAPGAPTAAEPEPKPPQRPLMKLYAYLRDLCLNYQLEALHFQASQLERSGWASHTRLVAPADRSSLTIFYWTHARPPPAPVTRLGQPPPKRPPAPIPQGSLTVRLKVDRHSSTKTRVMDFLNGYPPMVKRASDPVEADGDYGASYTKRLQVLWTPLELGSSPETANVTEEMLERLQIGERAGVVVERRAGGAVELAIELGGLSLEDMLQRAVQAHTDSILRRAFVELTRVDQSDPRPSFSLVRLVPWEPPPTTAKQDEPQGPSQKVAKAIEVVLHARHRVQVVIDRFSGQFRIRPVVQQSGLEDDCTQATVDQGSMKAFEERINREPGRLKEILIRVKSNILLDEIEFKAHRLGMRTTRHMPIRFGDLGRSSATTSRAPRRPEHAQRMFCTLAGFRHVYLVLSLTAGGIECALVELDTGSTGPTFGVRGWVEVKVPVFEADDGEEVTQTDEFTISFTQLDHMYHHCLVQAALHRIAASLRRHRVAYRQMLPLTQTASLGGDDTAPVVPLHRAHEPVGVLAVPTKACFKEQVAGGMKPNLAVRVTVERKWGSGGDGFGEIFVVFIVRFEDDKLLSLLLEKNKVGGFEGHKEEGVAVGADKGEEGGEGSAEKRNSGSGRMTGLEEDECETGKGVSENESSSSRGRQQQQPEQEQKTPPNPASPPRNKTSVSKKNDSVEGAGEDARTWYSDDKKSMWKVERDKREVRVTERVRREEELERCFDRFRKWF